MGVNATLFTVTGIMKPQNWEGNLGDHIRILQQGLSLHKHILYIKKI